MKPKVYQKISVKHPILLATWPGMGNVAIKAIDYIRRRLKLEPFAEIDAGEFVVPERVLIEQGIVELPNTPRNIFYYRNSPDLIIFEGETQIRREGGIVLVQEILNFVREFEGRRLFTGAAFPFPISYKEDSQIYVASNLKRLRDSLHHDYHLKVIESGEVSGLNGLLLGYAKEFGLPAACFLATIPLYAITLPNPKASKELVKIFERILDVHIGVTELELRIREVEREMSEIEERMGEHLKGAFEEEFREEEGVPSDVRERIEHLFYEVKRDRKKAYMLKEELDRWGLFEAYEDRFLDLFKRH